MVYVKVGFWFPTLIICFRCEPTNNNNNNNNNNNIYI